MLPTLYTLTGNLLWECTLEFASWAPGLTQRADRSSFQVGGKGINVARMLVRLNAPTEALCFAGGSTGENCISWLREKGIRYRAFTTQAPTRIGTVIRSSNQPETTFFSPDIAPDASAWLACAECIEQLSDHSVLAICGSFPGWTTPDAEPLRAALSRFAKRGSLIADSYGPSLRWALDQPLALIRINRTEFDAGLPTASDPVPFPLRLASAVERHPIDTWIVSDGEKDVWLAESGSDPHSFTPPQITSVSSTGSGDVMLACLLHGSYHLGLSWVDAIAYALPYSAANAAHPGIAEFHLDHLPPRHERDLPPSSGRRVRSYGVC